MSVLAEYGGSRALRSALTGFGVFVAVGSAGISPALAGGPHAAMVIDGNTGAILMNESGDDARYPASLTKMMTLYMVFEQIDAGRLTMDTRLKVSREANAAKPSKLDLDPGEEITVGDAVKALITKSANDASIVLAEAVGGTHREFANLMTAKARSIGMSKTTFRNANGLPDSNQTTTARDMLTLGLRLQDDFPKYYPLFAMQSFTFNGHAHKNHNKMLGKFEGLDGIKTGYTHASGFNIVTSVRQGGKHVVGVVFGGATGGSRDATMRVALTRALLKASPVKTRKSGPQLIARARVAPAPVTVSAAPAIAPAPAPFTPAPLAVAKVRPVMVAARPRPPEPPAPAVAPAPQPPPVMQQVAGVVSAPGRGAPPSSFQAQARNLSGGDAPATASPTISSAANTELPRKAKPGFMQAGSNPPYRLGGALPADDAAPEPLAVAAAPASVTVPLAAGTNTGFHVQIGAYTTAAESERMLASVKDKAPAAIAGATQLTSPINKENRKLYRARFAGFDARGAAKACQSLRQQSIDCFVMKAE
jgi:D-alanyl-D-alanine carboxypeptidase